MPDTLAMPLRIYTCVLKNAAIYSETFEIIHMHGIITLLAIYKIPKLKYVFVHYTIHL